MKIEKRATPQETKKRMFDNVVQQIKKIVKKK